MAPPENLWWSSVVVLAALVVVGGSFLRWCSAASVALEGLLLIRLHQSLMASEYRHVPSTHVTSGPTGRYTHQHQQCRHKPLNTTPALGLRTWDVGKDQVDQFDSNAPACAVLTRQSSRRITALRGLGRNLNRHLHLILILILIVLRPCLCHRLLPHCPPTRPVVAASSKASLSSALASPQPRAGASRRHHLPRPLSLSLSLPTQLIRLSL